MTGEVIRIARGAYVETAEWDRLTPEQQHLLLVRAAIRQTDQDLVVARASAVVLHGLPWIGSLPARAQFAPASGVGRSTKAMSVSGYQVTELDTIDDLPVTRLARTVVDVARGIAFERALAVADAALRRAPDLVPALRQQFDQIGRHQGEARAALVLELADGASESAGESLSRAAIHRMRLPSPELQAVFPRRDGGTWRVDFWWPDAGVIGEFDGQVKYLGDGHGAARAVIAEKLREDELRALGYRVERWDWETARDPSRLAAQLTRAGIRPRTARSATWFGP